MNRFTLEQRWEILKTYFQSECHVAETVRALKIKFGRNNAPTAPAVRKFVKKVREIGMLIDNTSYPRIRAVRSVENIAAVAESVRLNPKISTRERSQQLNISRTTLRRILANTSCSSNKSEEFISGESAGGSKKKLSKGDKKNEYEGNYHQVESSGESADDKEDKSAPKSKPDIKVASKKKVELEEAIGAEKIKSKAKKRKQAPTKIVLKKKIESDDEEDLESSTHEEVADKSKSKISVSKSKSATKRKSASKKSNKKHESEDEEEKSEIDDEDSDKRT